jgi:hypothetical protein
MENAGKKVPLRLWVRQKSLEHLVVESGQAARCRRFLMNVDVKRVSFFSTVPAKTLTDKNLFSIGSYAVAA